MIDYSVGGMFLVPTLSRITPTAPGASSLCVQAAATRPDGTGFVAIVRRYEIGEWDSAAKKIRVADFGSKHFPGRGWNFARERARDRNSAVLR